MIIKSNIARKNNIQEIALPDGVIDVIINITRQDGVYWSAGGLKIPEGIHLSWDGGRLMEGDEIEINLADINKVTPHVYEESHSLLKKRMIAVTQNDIENENDLFWQHKLERYYRLKKILEDENII